MNSDKKLLEKVLFKILSYAKMAIEMVWFLDLNWVYMSLIAAGFAAGIHLISAIIAAARIGRFSTIIFIIAAPIYTFVSCFFYTIILAISVGYTYYFTKTSADSVYVYWGLGFGAFYVILKVVIAGYLK